MMMLAIFQNERVYEGNPNFLNAVYPMPSISKVVIDAPDRPELFSFGNVNPSVPPIFREDSFDPTTRIRRGRFYLPDNPNRRDWQAARVNHYPYAYPVAGPPQFYSFDSFCFFQPAPIRLAMRPVVVLGDVGYRTAWHVVGAERLFTGETLFTLKAAETLGLLPDLHESAIPPARVGDIRDSIEKVADAAYKYLSVSVVDVCRESARVMLTVWLSAIGVDGVKGDLAEVIKKIPAQNEGLRAAARIINRLHPRGKSSERERQADRGKDLRSVSSEDAELSVALIGFLLREAGWAA